MAISSLGVDFLEKAVIDRIVDDKYAVLLVGENETEVTIFKEVLPDGAKEGTWLKVVLTDGKLEKIDIDTTETASREIEIKNKMDKLRQKSKSNYKV